MKRNTAEQPSFTDAGADPDGRVDVNSDTDLAWMGREGSSTGEWSRLVPAPAPTPADPAQRIPPNHESPRTRARNTATERDLGQEQWLAVYDAFQTTGVPAELALATQLPVNVVNHLLNKGLARLGLPPILEHAVDLSEVNRRLASHSLPPLIPTTGDAAGTSTASTVPFNGEVVRDAVAERVAKEAAAAQTLLSAMTSLAGVHAKILERALDLANDGFIALPDEIGPKEVQTLSLAAEKLSAALDRAVRLSRFTAGEPERRMAVEVMAIVDGLTDDELIHLDLTGEFPARLRGRALAAGGRLPGGPPRDALAASVTLMPGDHASDDTADTGASPDDDE